MPEVVAIRAACKALGDFQLKGCVVYSSCEPCPMCLSALYWSRCDAIFFGNSAADATAAGFDDSFLYEEVAKPMGQRTLPIKRLLGDEAIERLQRPCARRQIRSNTDMAIKKTSRAKSVAAVEDRDRFGRKDPVKIGGCWGLAPSAAQWHACSRSRSFPASN